MRRFLLVLLLLLPGVGVSQAAERLNDAEAVNYAGSLRYLSQRVMKNYLAVGAAIRPDKAHQQLDESVAEFEQHLQQLTGSSLSPQYKSHQSILPSFCLASSHQLVVSTPVPFPSLQLSKQPSLYQMKRI